MHATCRRPTLLLLALLTICVSASTAAALPACTAADVIAADGGCPNGSGPCTIALSFEIGDGCTLDFSGRAVTVASTSVVSAAVGATQLASFTIKAASLTIRGNVNARAAAASGAQAFAGMITILVSGDLSVDPSGGVGKLDVSGHAATGRLQIVAGGSVTINGRTQADGIGLSGTAAAGGSIEITAAGDIVSTNTDPNLPFVISAAGSSSLSDGGNILLDAGGSVQLATPLAVSGINGGTIRIDSQQTVDLTGATAAGNVGGNAGCLDIVADRDVRVLGAVLARGGSGGGTGGNVSIDVIRGNISVEADIIASSGATDGVAGDIDLEAGGTLTIKPAINVVASGGSGDSCGGTITLDVQRTLLVQGKVDARGGIGGGLVDITSATKISIEGTVTAAGLLTGSCGGDLTITAGDRRIQSISDAGQLAITGSVDVSAPGCTITRGCSLGGSAALEGCDVLVEPTGSVLAQAAVGGQIDLIAHQSLTMNGQIRATTVDDGTTCVDGSNCVDGLVSLTYPPQSLAPSDGGDTLPPPDLFSIALCASSSDGDCLVPCPVCGNNAIEYPEACDDGDGLNCDGCGTLCDLEDCNDGVACTTDLCDQDFGCYSVPAPSPCIEPPTRTPTITGTPTQSRTPSNTRTITLTPLPSSTPTQTATVSPTGTASLSPTVTATSTPTRSPSRTPTVSATRTPTVTATRTASSTPTLSPLLTFTPTLSPTISPTRTVSLTATRSATATPTRTPSLSPTLTATVQPSATPTQSTTATASRTSTTTSTRTPTSTATQTVTSQPSSSPTATATVSATHTPTLTLTPTRTGSSTPTLAPSSTPTSSPTTVLPSATATPSASPTRTAPPTSTATHSPTQTPSNTTPVATSTSTLTPQVPFTVTMSPTTTPSLPPSPTASLSPTSIPASPSATPSVSPSSTPTRTATNTMPTLTATAAPSSTPSATPSTSPSLTPTPTPTPTHTATHSSTPTPTSSATAVATSTPTAPASVTPTESPTPLPSATPTQTASLSATSTHSVTPTQTGSPTPSPLPARPGDANCDDRIGAGDLTAAIVAISHQQPMCGADANGDGSLDTDDLTEIQRLLFGDN